MPLAPDKPIIIKNLSEPTGPGNAISAGPKLFICMALSICAFVTRTPLTLFILFLFNVGIFVGFRNGPITLRREIKVFCWQIIIITGLYVIRFGLKDGVIPGMLTSLQLFLAFFPGVIFIQTTPQTQIVMSLEKVMPYKAAFVVSTSIRFIPFMIREIKSIYEAQVFRGAKILPKDLINPLNWKDVIHCLLFPAIVQCMVAAGEIATAAKARNFGHRNKRTNWPGP